MLKGQREPERDERGEEGAFPGRVLPRGLWDPHQVWGGGNVPETTLPHLTKGSGKPEGKSMKPLVFCFFLVFFLCDTFIPGIEGNSFLQKEIQNPF